MDDRATLLPRHTMYHHFCSLELDQAGPTDTNYGAGWEIGKPSDRFNLCFDHM